MTRTIEPREASRRLAREDEVAFIDVREAGPFSMGHPLFAVPAPYGRLEAVAGALMPRATVPVMVIDGGDGTAERAAAVLTAMGYADVSVIAGGAPGWEAAGLTLFQGVNVPSKALGELAEALWHPKTIEAETLAQWKREGRPFHFFDVRPPSEHAKMRVPGTRCLPNGELAHRLACAVPEDDAPIVVTCAGRTRGLVGALSLERAGAGRAVYALENGTQGWALAGEALERGMTPEPFPAMTAHAAAAAAERAEALIAREGIATVRAAEIDALRADETRTTYVFDVRSPEESAADPVACAVPAPAGQLVQASDQWAAVRRARMVLVDDAGLRGALAAFWLRGLGYEVAVARLDDDVRALRPASRPAAPQPTPPRLSAAGALRALAGGATLCDLRSSSAYNAAHVEGAEWAHRAALVGEPQAGPLVLLGGDGADHAAAELAAAGHTVSVVDGGHEALAKAGAPVVRDAPLPAGRAVDAIWFAAGRHEGNLDASRLYLSWEQGLIAQLSPEERAAFLIGV